MSLARRFLTTGLKNTSVSNFALGRTESTLGFNGSGNSLSEYGLSSDDDLSDSATSADEEEVSLPPLPLKKRKVLSLTISQNTQLLNDAEVYRIDADTAPDDIRLIPNYIHHVLLCSTKFSKEALNSIPSHITHAHIDDSNPKTAGYLSHKTITGLPITITTLHLPENTKKSSLESIPAHVTRVYIVNPEKKKPHIPSHVTVIDAETNQEVRQPIVPALARVEVAKAILPAVLEEQPPVAPSFVEQLDEAKRQQITAHYIQVAELIKRHREALADFDANAPLCLVLGDDVSLQAIRNISLQTKVILVSHQFPEVKLEFIPAHIEVRNQTGLMVRRPAKAAVREYIQQEIESQKKAIADMEKEIAEKKEALKLIDPNAIHGIDVDVQVSGIPRRSSPLASSSMFFKPQPVATATTTTTTTTALVSNIEDRGHSHAAKK